MEIVLQVGKGAKFEVEKVNSGQNICNRCANVGNGKNFEKEAQHSKYRLDTVFKVSTCNRTTAETV